MIKKDFLTIKNVETVVNNSKDLCTGESLLVALNWITGELKSEKFDDNSSLEEVQGDWISIAWLGEEITYEDMLDVIIFWLGCEEISYGGFEWVAANLPNVDDDCEMEEVKVALHHWYMVAIMLKKCATGNWDENGNIETVHPACDFKLVI